MAVVQYTFTHKQYTVQQYSTHLHTNNTQYSSTVHIYTQTIHSTAVQYTFTHKHYTVQQYSTHLHTNNTQNDTKQTLHRTTQQFGTLLAVPHLCGFYPGMCLTSGKKTRRNLSQGSRRVLAGTIKIHKHRIRIYRHNNKYT